MSTTTLRTSLSRGPFALLSAVVAQVARTVATWSRRHRQRRELAALEPEQLRDVGIHPADAYGEWSKPFWRR